MKKVLSVLVALAILATMSAFAMTASATVSGEVYVLPVDDIDSWLAENMEPYAWAQPLAEGVDTINAEVTSEGMVLSFPEGSDMTYPHARVEDPAGLVQTTEDDYISIKASLGNAGDTDIRWGLTIVNVDGSFNINDQITKAAGAELFNGGSQIPGGDYDVTLKLSDVIKAVDEREGTDYYNGMYGADGNSYITGFRFYLFSEGCVTDRSLVIKELTVGPQGADGDSTNSTASTESTASTDSKASSTTSTTSKTSSKTQVSTGESVMPIIGVAALAVVAASAVVVSRKKK